MKKQPKEGSAEWRRLLRDELVAAREESVLLLATIKEAKIAENARRVLQRVEHALEMLPRR